MPATLPMKRVFVVTGGDTTDRYYEEPEALARLREHAADLVRLIDAGDIDVATHVLNVQLYVDEEPDGLFAELVLEYSQNIHGRDDVDGMADVIEHFTLDPDAGFLLVQESRHGGYWLGSYGSVDDAASYIDSEEYAEDWETVGLWELRTGDRYDASPTTTFTKADPA